MGQRLVINIKKDNKRIANIYYHWSAYPFTAMQATKYILDNFCNTNIEVMGNKSLILRLIRILEDNGGGVSLDDYEYVKNLYPNEEFKQDGNRNYGLIRISNKSNEEEGFVEIDVTNHMIYNDVVYLEYFIDINELAYVYNIHKNSINDKYFKTLSINPAEMSFNQFYSLYNEIYNDQQNRSNELCSFNPHLYKYNNTYFNIRV